jgi:hypothetical protein
MSEEKRENEISLTPSAPGKSVFINHWLKNKKRNTDFRKYVNVDENFCTMYEKYRFGFQCMIFNAAAQITLRIQMYYCHPRYFATRCIIFYS